MGGLAVQRAPLNYADLTARAQHVVLFATPSRGLAEAGVLWRLKRQLRDMAKGGKFVKKLKADWSAQFGLHTHFKSLRLRGRTTNLYRTNRHSHRDQSGDTGRSNF